MKKIIVPALMLSLTFASCGSNSDEYEETTYEVNYPEKTTSNDYKKSSEPEEPKEEETVSSAASRHWDAILDDYEAIMAKYIKVFNKAQAGDMSAITDYTSLLTKLEGLQNKLDKGENEMTPEQMKRFIDIQAKMSKDAVDMMQ